MEGSKLKAYVTADGNFGADEVLVFESSELTDQQWENLSFLSDGERILYAEAIIADDPEAVAKFERYL
jgi:hypothetical protein